MTKIQFSDFNEYRGYTGSLEYCRESMCYHGKVNNTRDLVTYEAKTREELENEFKKAVDDYIEFKRTMVGYYEKNTEPTNFT